MKVAVVAEWYPSPSDPVHGIWAHRQALATAAAGAELRVLVLRRPIPPLSVARRVVSGDLDALHAWSAGARQDLEPWELDGLAVRPVRWYGPPRPLTYGAWGYWMAPSLGRALSRLHAEWPFDLVHAHNLAPTGQAALMWTRRHDVGLVLSAHGPDIIDVPSRSGIGRHAVRSALAGADLVLANSGWARRRCLELAGGGAPEILTLHLGADLPGSAPSVAVGGGAGAAPEVGGGAGGAPEVGGGAGGAPEVGGGAGEASAAGGGAGGAPAASGSGAPLRLATIAHLQARKGHANVLRAIATIDRARRPSYEVIGDGEERERLVALAERLEISALVTFTGQLPHAEALARLAEADLYVMPGVEEPFGVAFVEAMAAGLAAVGCRGEGGPEDIAAAGEGMVMVRAGDVAELAGLISRLDADRTELARLGAAARETVAAHFTWERCGIATVAAYERVLAARGRGGTAK